MPRIKCHYIDCQLLDDGYCSAALVEIDPDAGCMSFQPSDVSGNDDTWDEDEMDEWDEESESDDDDDDDLWLDDEDYEE